MARIQKQRGQKVGSATAPNVLLEIRRGLFKVDLLFSFGSPVAQPVTETDHKAISACDFRLLEESALSLRNNTFVNGLTS